MHQLAVQPRLVERVYTSILEDICNGGLPVGMRLAQEWLAERLNVSRQPVGQALSLLKSQGLVCEVGRRGLMVAPLDPALVRSIYAVRGVLDRLAARTAAQRCEPRAVQRGEQILANGRRALASGSIAALIVADVAFHRFIYELSDNPIIAETMALHWNHMRRVMSAYLKHLDWAGDTWAEHAEILRLILAGEVEGAEQLAGAHVDKASRLLQVEFLGAASGAAPPSASRGLEPSFGPEAARK